MTHDRLNLRENATEVLQALAQVEQVLDASSLDAALRHLVKLRASQINGCAFCVNMHIKEARRDGESSERLDHLVVWRDVDDFTDAERAALDWTEALTSLEALGELDDLHVELTRHFTESTVAALTTVVGMINVWNRLAIGAHGGSYHKAA